MRIFLSGSSTVLGTAVMESLFNAGHALYSSPDTYRLDDDIGSLLQQQMMGQDMDVIILLQGEELFETSCTETKIEKRCADHLEVNRHICKFFLKQNEQPKTIICVSSVHYYNIDNLEVSSERSRKGSDFLAEYFTRLEETTSVFQPTTRTVHLRFGKVVSKNAAPVFPRLPFLQRHLPCLLHDKNTFISWVSREDAVRALLFLLENDSISGPVNIVSGETVSKDQFNNSIATKFGLRKTLPLPSFLVQLILGKDITSLFNAGSRAMPLKIMKAGFLFQDISLPEYLQDTN